MFNIQPNIEDCDKWIADFPTPDVLLWLPRPIVNQATNQCLNVNALYILPGKLIKHCRYIVEGAHTILGSWNKKQ